MRHRLAWIAAITCFICAGCVPVPSLYPAVQGDGIPVPQILGKWNPTDDSAGIVRFERDSTGRCIVTWPLTDTTSVRLRARFDRFGGRLFADLLLDPASLPGGDPSPFAVPMHLFARIDFGHDTLSLGALDDDWVKKAVEEGRLRVRLEKPEGGPLLAESTPGLRRMLEQVANEDGAFTPVVMVRRR